MPCNSLHVCARKQPSYHFSGSKFVARNCQKISAYPTFLLHVCARNYFRQSKCGYRFHSRMCKNNNNISVRIWHVSARKSNTHIPCGYLILARILPKNKTQLLTHLDNFLHVSASNSLKSVPAQNRNTAYICETR